MARRSQLDANYCQLISYILTKLGVQIPADVVDSVHFGGYDSAATIHQWYLLTLIHKMTSKRRESIVYNAHCPTSRRLADFWDGSKEAYLAKLKKEREEVKKQEAIQRALAKLTPKERHLLGH